MLLRWKRSCSVQKPVTSSIRGCIQSKGALQWTDKVPLIRCTSFFRSGRFLILYSESFHMHSQGCTFVWKTLTWILSIWTFYLSGQKTFRDGEIYNREGGRLGSVQFQFSQEEMQSISFKLAVLQSTSVDKWFGGLSEFNAFTALIEVKLDWLQYPVNVTLDDKNIF